MSGIVELYRKESSGPGERFRAVIEHERMTVPQKVDQVLAIGCQCLDLELGIVSRIEDQNYEVLRVHRSSSLEINAGDRYPLRLTYCSIVVATRSLVAFPDVTSSEWSDHPAYGDNHLKAYIGVPLIVDGSVHGTLNFSGRDKAPQDFSTDCVAIIHDMANWISAELGQSKLI